MSLAAYESASRGMAEPTESRVAPLCVQFGCGLDAPDGWLSFDASPTLRLQKLPVIGRLARRPGFPPWPENARYGDVLAGLPLPALSVDAVYCSHVLDHLSREDGLRAMREVHRLLRPGGTFRLVLHDLRALASAYLDSPDSFAAYRFMRESILGQEVRPRGISPLLRDWLGNHRHRWMWDEQSLGAELRIAGFREVRRARFGDCGDQRLAGSFALVERESRWVNDLGLEARK